MGKNLTKTFTSLFSGQFAFFASLASILGLCILFISDKWYALIALIFFCLMLLVFTIHLIRSLNKILSVRNGDHESKSTFVKYETLDGNTINYETFKLIQVKKPVLTEWDYYFKWTGTHLPVVTSDLQSVEDVMDLKDPRVYNKAILKFKKPIYYNQSVVIHFKATLDDTDKASKSHVETRVTDEVDIIHYRIILKDKPATYVSNAVLEKCRIESDVSTSFEKIKEIAFDPATKSYEYHLLNPEIGYYYRIRWKR